MKKFVQTYRLEVLLFVLLFVAYSFVHGGWGFNQASRLNVLQAITFDHTLSIDNYHGNTGDKSLFEGRYYSDKAPGFIPLAMPGFLVAVGVLQEGFGKTIYPGGATSWMTTALSAGLIAALGGAFMLLLLRKYVATPFALATTVGFFLGSLPFPYATVLFSHAMTIGLLSIALWAVLRKNTLAEWDMVAGFAAGMAVITEYPAGIAAGGIFLLLRFRPKRIFFFVLGALPPIGFHLTHNYLAFDSMFSLGYEHVDGWAGMKLGLFGVQFVPKPGALSGLLVGSKQGLLTWSPFLLLAIPGLVPLWKKDRWLAIVCVLVVILQVVLMSSYSYWDGGNALSARHLSAALPFFAIATAYGVSLFPRVATALIALSLLLIGGATLAEPGLPPEQNPIWGYYLPKYSAGSLKPNWFILLGLPSLIAAVWFFALEFLAIGFLLRTARQAQVPQTKHKEESRSA